MRLALLLLALGATGFANDEWHGMAVGVAVAAFSELGIRLLWWMRDAGMWGL